LKLIIADDELYVRESLSELDWNRYGITLAGTASDGREAVDLCRKLLPDLLLTDIRMPHLSGLEAMKLLKAEFPAMKFIILSGWSEFEYARGAIRLGASDYLIKPCRDEEIADAVRVALTQPAGKRQVQALGSMEEQAPSAKRHAVRMACSQIQEDLSIAVTLSEVAEKVNMNASALSRLFRQEMGCSFSEYVTSARMNMAKKLLIESNMKVHEIAQKVGYVSVSHFVQVFGDYTGITPGTFREMNG
jgi:two-component system, response regulator YesN